MFKDLTDKLHIQQLAQRVMDEDKEFSKLKTAESRKLDIINENKAKCRQCGEHNTKGTEICYACGKRTNTIENILRAQIVRYTGKEDYATIDLDRNTLLTDMVMHRFALKKRLHEEEEHETLRDDWEEPELTIAIVKTYMEDRWGNLVPPPSQSPTLEKKRRDVATDLKKKRLTGHHINPEWTCPCGHDHDTIRSLVECGQYRPWKGKTWLETLEEHNQTDEAIDYMDWILVTRGVGMTTPAHQAKQKAFLAKWRKKRDEETRAGIEPAPKYKLAYKSEDVSAITAKGKSVPPKLQHSHAALAAASIAESCSLMSVMDERMDRARLEASGSEDTQTLHPADPRKWNSAGYHITAGEMEAIAKQDEEEKLADESGGEVSYWQHQQWQAESWDEGWQEDWSEEAQNAHYSNQQKWY
jgi:hypothetical protein